MQNERYLICEATGDRGDLAEYFLLRITPYLLGSVRRLMEEAAGVNNKCGGNIDVTERGDVEFIALYDLPAGDSGDIFEKIENWEFSLAPLLLTFGSDEHSELSRRSKTRRTECHGVQAWPGTLTVRLTCYPKEDTYRIESRESIHNVLEELRRDFSYEQKRG